jgi:hypothetical protein
VEGRLVTYFARGIIEVQLQFASSASGVQGEEGQGERRIPWRDGTTERLALGLDGAVHGSGGSAGGVWLGDEDGDGG